MRAESLVVTTTAAPSASTSFNAELGRAARPSGTRAIRPHRALPGGRAVVGGFLVAVSAVGLFAAYAGANRRDSTPVALAARPIAAGDRIAPGDIRWVPMDLPAAIRRRTIHSAAGTNGRLFVGPVAEGELIQTGDLLPEGEAPGFRELTVEVEAAQLRVLQEGDTVDVLVSTGSGDGARTRIAASGVRVVRLPSGGSSSTGSKPAVTLAMPTFDATYRLVAAAHAGTLTLVRSTGLPSQPTTYEPNDRPGP